ncbi:hypothetical protein F5Y17DRAFT_64267 [Xylariaceae sp. FL0594]|nr:hypothetical protein F5Y17DRAFT_64267 [Xylariaceae sp. FL0594]
MRLRNHGVCMYIFTLLSSLHWFRQGWVLARQGCSCRFFPSFLGSVDTDGQVLVELKIHSVPLRGTSTVDAGFLGNNEENRLCILLFPTYIIQEAAPSHKKLDDSYNIRLSSHLSWPASCFSIIFLLLFYARYRLIPSLLFFIRASPAIVDICIQHKHIYIHLALFSYPQTAPPSTAPRLVHLCRTGWWAK